METFLQHIEDSLSEVPEGPLSAETDFKGLKAWDSLAVLTVTDTIDMEYGVLLKKADYQSCVTLRELYDLISTKR
jgi:acyl carrier protein